jgi:hypothetical protein
LPVDFLYINQHDVQVSDGDDDDDDAQEISITFLIFFFVLLLFYAFFTVIQASYRNVHFL